MVWGDAGADQPPWGGQPLEHVYPDVQVRAFDQRTGSIEAGRSGPDDGNR
jgi:hypothetical protein